MSARYVSRCVALSSFKRFTYRDNGSSTIPLKSDENDTSKILLYQLALQWIMNCLCLILYNLEPYVCVLHTHFYSVYSPYSLSPHNKKNHPRILLGRLSIRNRFFHILLLNRYNFTIFLN